MRPVRSAWEARSRGEVDECRKALWEAVRRRSGVCVCSRRQVASAPRQGGAVIVDQPLDAADADPVLLGQFACRRAGDIPVDQGLDVVWRESATQAPRPWMHVSARLVATGPPGGETVIADDDLPGCFEIGEEARGVRVGVRHLHPRSEAIFHDRRWPLARPYSSEVQQR